MMMVKGVFDALFQIGLWRFTLLIGDRMGSWPAENPAQFSP